LVDWRWYYQLPSLTFWTLAMVPLLLLRESRRPQAWAILAPRLAVVVGSRMLTTMLFLSPGASEPFGIFCGTFATAWAIVWLLGPWLDKMPDVAAFLLAGLVMFRSIASGFAASCAWWMRPAHAISGVDLG